MGKTSAPRPQSRARDIGSLLLDDTPAEWVQHGMVCPGLLDLPSMELPPSRQARMGAWCVWHIFSGIEGPPYQWVLHRGRERRHLGCICQESSFYPMELVGERRAGGLALPGEADGSLCSGHIHELLTP